MNENPGENKEEKVETKKNKKENKDELKRIQEEFVEENLNEYGIAYIKKGNANISKDFKDFLDINYPEFHSKYFTENKTDIIKGINNQLKITMAEYSIPHKNIRDTVENSFDAEYDFSQNQRDKLILKLDSLDKKDLKELLSGDSFRKEYLLKNTIVKNSKELSELLINDSKESELENFIDGLGIKMQGINDSAKATLIKIIERHIGTNYAEVSSKEISDLFRAIGDKKVKKSLLRFFINKVSYKELINYGIITKNSFDEKIIDLIEKYYKENLNEPIDRKDINSSLIRKFKPEDFFEDISTLSDTELDNFFEGGEALKEKISYDISKNINNACVGDKCNAFGDSIMSKLVPDDSGNINNSFIEHIQGDKDISDLNVKSKIGLLQKGNYITVTQKNSSLGDIVSYYKINDVDIGATMDGKTISLKDITAIGGINKGEKGKNETQSYDDIYNLLKASSSNGDIKVDFFSTNEFGNKEIEEIPEVEGISTKEELIKKIDNEVSNGGEKGIKPDDNMTFIHKGGDGNGGNMVFNVTKFDDKKGIVTVKGGTTISDISYADLYRLFKTDKNFSIAKDLKNVDDFYSKTSGDYSKLNIDTDNNLFVNSNDKNISYKYLVSRKEGKAIIINELSNGSVEYTFGKFKDDKIEKTYYSATGFLKLHEDIKKYGLNLEPDIEKKIQLDTKEEKGVEPESKKNRIKSFLGRASIMDIGLAIKQIPDILGESMKQGNELQSARMALKMGKMLGDDVYFTLKSQLAEKENSTIDKLVDNWKRLGTNDLMKIVNKVLTNENAPRYEVDAATTVLLKKYGNLYPKNFGINRGSFAWYKKYKKFAGESFDLKNDSLYIKTKTECEEASNSASGKPDPKPFTEELLLETYLKGLDKEDNGIVRAKADKHFANAKAEGIRESKESGKDKIGGMMTAAERISTVLGSLKSREHAEFVGGLGEIFKKHGSAVDMHHVPFVLTLSGEAEYFDQTVTKDLIGISWSSPYTELFFNKSQESRGQFKNFIRELVEKRYKQEGGKESPAYLKLEKALSKTNHVEKISKISSFWNEYGAELVESMNGNDGIIHSEPENNIFKEYNDTIEMIVTDGEYNLSREEIFAGEFEKNNTAYTRNGALLSNLDNSLTGGVLSKTIFNTYLSSLDNIKKMNITDDKKKSLFIKIFEPFEKEVRTLAKGSINRAPRQNGKISKDIYDQIPGLDILEQKGLGIFKGNVKEESIQYSDYLDGVWSVFSGLGIDSTIENVSGKVSKVTEKEENRKSITEINENISNKIN